MIQAAFFTEFREEYEYWYRNPALHPMAFEPYLLVSYEIQVLLA